MRNNKTDAFSYLVKVDFLKIYKVYGNRHNMNS